LTADQKEFSAHVVHSEADKAEYVPGEQFEQELLAIVGAYLPGPQSAQMASEVAPICRECLPVTQATQVASEVAATAAEYLPATQLTHERVHAVEFRLPTGEVNPTGQVWQNAPTFTTPLSICQVRPHPLLLLV